MSRSAPSSAPQLIEIITFFFSSALHCLDLNQTSELSSNSSRYVSFQNYVATVFENYTASFEIDKQRIELNMWDTSGKTRLGFVLIVMWWEELTVKGLGVFPNIQAVGQKHYQPHLVCVRIISWFATLDVLFFYLSVLFVYLQSCHHLWS